MTKRSFNAKIIKQHFAGVAQSVEQLIRNQQVRGSSPLTSSKKAQFGIISNCSFFYLRGDLKGKRYRANFRWTFATAEDRARSSRENQVPSPAPRKRSSGLSRTVLFLLLVVRNAQAAYAANHARCGFQIMLINIISYRRAKSSFYISLRYKSQRGACAFSHIKNN